MILVNKQSEVAKSKREWNVRIDDVILGPSEGQWMLLAALVL